jgi:phosphoribosylglycinamide formyltransferase-1
MLKIAVLVSGGGTNLQAIIDKIESNELKNVEIVAVLSNKKNAYALERAQKHHIENRCICAKDYPSKEAFSQEMIQYLLSKEVDLVVLAGFLVVLSKSFIDAFKDKIINIHPSLIPSFCGPGQYGLKVHESAIARGVKVTGATVHFVDEGTDTGPIIMQKAVQVMDTDTKETLQQRVMEEAEWVILPKVINLIAAGKIKVIEGKTIIS